MNIVDDLRAKAEFARDEADRLRNLVTDHEASIKRYRERIDAAELEAVGAMVAANILEGVRLKVDRVDGVPHVSIGAEEPLP
jgi:nitrogen-specific signal transduction histidine kinase